jgi:apolipoprotein D and lipocalin family protein
MKFCRTRPITLAAVAALTVATLTLLGGCAVNPKRVTIPVAPQVDLQKFMGPWYVIANIPTFIEKGAHNAIESYALDADGTIDTTFTFNQGAFDGPAKKYNPRGFVVEGTNNAIWGMRFVWPIKAEYVISYVDPAYSETIIGRSARDYVWIMARTPTISAERYDAMLARVKQFGYDVSKVQTVPQTPVQRVSRQPGT